MLKEKGLDKKKDGKWNKAVDHHGNIGKEGWEDHEEIPPNLLVSVQQIKCSLPDTAPYLSVPNPLLCIGRADSAESDLKS